MLSFAFKAIWYDIYDNICIQSHMIFTEMKSMSTDLLCIKCMCGHNRRHNDILLIIKVGSFFQSVFFRLVFSGFYRPGKNRFYPFLDKTGKKTLQKLKTTIENPESYKKFYI